MELLDEFGASRLVECLKCAAAKRGSEVEGMVRSEQLTNPRIGVLHVDDDPLSVGIRTLIGGSSGTTEFAERGVQLLIVVGLRRRRLRSQE